MAFNFSIFCVQLFQVYFFGNTLYLLCYSREPWDDLSNTFTFCGADESYVESLRSHHKESHTRDDHDFMCNEKHRSTLDDLMNQLWEPILTMDLEGFETMRDKEFSSDDEASASEESASDVSAPLSPSELKPFTGDQVKILLGFDDESVAQIWRKTLHTLKSMKRLDRELYPLAKNEQDANDDVDDSSFQN